MTLFDDMGPLPRIHPREALARQAEMDVRTAFTAATDGLTTGETLRVCAAVFGAEVSHIAKYSIRAERHGDDDTSGGVAP